MFDFVQWAILLGVSALIAFHTGRQYERNKQASEEFNRQWDKDQAAMRAAEVAARAGEAERSKDPQGRSIEERAGDLELGFRVAFGLRPDKGRQPIADYLAALERSLEDRTPHPSIMVRVQASTLVSARKAKGQAPQC